MSWDVGLFWWKEWTFKSERVHTAVQSWTCDLTSLSQSQLESGDSCLSRLLSGFSKKR